MDNIKLGLIGGGYWGKNLIRDFYSLGVLKTVCDVNTEALKNYKNMYPELNTTTNWDNILEDVDITAVCISLPAEMHYKFAKSALEANKDVYVEKPITLDINEAQELINLAKEKNNILMVGHLLHYHPAIVKIKELIDSGSIGRIKNIISNRLNLGKFRVAENVLWSFAPHDISVILSLCGNKLPDKVRCSGQDFITRGIHDITNTILLYEQEGIYVNINVNWLNPYKEQKLVIIGESGMILFDDTVPTDKLRLFSNYIEWSPTVPSLPSPVKEEGTVIELDMSVSPLTRECEHFINCCLTREDPITDGDEGVRVLKVLNSSHESLIGRGKEVSIDSKEEKKGKNYFVHSSATVDSGAVVGKGSKIWHYSHISGGSTIGDNCNVGQNVFIAGGAKLGNGCKVQNNVSIYAGVECEDYVFLGPSCVLTNDINPRAEHSKGGQYLKTYIEVGATIGANATIVCGNKVGHHALVGAGAVVTKDVPPYSIVVGNPAKVIGKIDEYGNRVLNK